MHSTALMTLMAGGEGAASPWSTVIMLAAIFAIFYFLLIRPQKKQQQEHEEMVKSLEKGDQVVTIGGIIGRIVHIEDDQIVLKTSGETRIELDRSKVGRIVGDDGESE